MHIFGIYVSSFFFRFYEDQPQINVHFFFFFGSKKSKSRQFTKYLNIDLTSNHLSRNHWSCATFSRVVAQIPNDIPRILKFHIVSVNSTYRQQSGRLNSIALSMNISYKWMLWPGSVVFSSLEMDERKRFDWWFFVKWTDISIWVYIKGCLVMNSTQQYIVIKNCARIRIQFLGTKARHTHFLLYHPVFENSEN